MAFLYLLQSHPTPESCSAVLTAAVTGLEEAHWCTLWQGMQFCLEDMLLRYT